MGLTIFLSIILINGIIVCYFEGKKRGYREGWKDCKNTCLNALNEINKEDLSKTEQRLIDIGAID